MLIVDDDVGVRLSVRSIVAAKRPEWQICGEVEDGAKAVAKVLELTPDAVILDLAMPVMNGIEAAKQIRRAAPSTKIARWGEMVFRNIQPKQTYLKLLRRCPNNPPFRPTAPGCCQPVSRTRFGLRRDRYQLTAT